MAGKRFFRINDLVDRSHLYVVAVDPDDMRRIVGDTCLEFGAPARRLPEAEAQGSVVIDELDSIAAASVPIRRLDHLFGMTLVSLVDREPGDMFFLPY